MATSIDIARVRRVLKKGLWGVPREFGPDGWRIIRRDRQGSVIITCASHSGQEWIHASIAYVDHMPTYEDVKTLWQAVFGDAYAYMVFPPQEQHVNIHEYALHLWGRADGKAAMPEFAQRGLLPDGKLSI